MAYDEITLINGACAEIGADPIDTLDDDTPSGRAAALIYGSLLDYCVGVFEFPFASEVRQLAQRSGVINNTGYAYVYALPAERVENPIKCAPLAADFDRNHFTDYFIAADDLYASASTMFALIRTRPIPSRMSATFRKAFQHGLAGELAMALASDKVLRVAYHEETFGPPSAMGTGGLMGGAIQAARKASPSRGPWTGSDPLTDQWRSDGGSWSPGQSFP